MDIHNKEFKHSFRGYNEDEIDEFLDQVVNDYEKLFRENDKLKEEVARLQKDADSYQERDAAININAITNVYPYGQCIMGNRTLNDNKESKGLIASSFLNLRNLVCDVKAKVREAAQTCLFEQNTDILWVNFKAQITPLLDRMVTGQGIKSYKIVKMPSKVKARLTAQIVLTPIYAIEDVYVTIVLTDDEAEIS